MSTFLRILRILFNDFLTDSHKKYIYRVLGPDSFERPLREFGNHLVRNYWANDSQGELRSERRRYRRLVSGVATQIDTRRRRAACRRAAFAAAVLFPTCCENVSGSYVFHGQPPGATGTDAAMPAALHYHDVGIARDKPARPQRPRLARSFSFGKARRDRSPRSARRRLPRSAERIDPRRKDTARETRAGQRRRWSWCAASSGREVRVNSRQEFRYICNVIVTGGDIRVPE